ncbi:hypothetical protein DKM44_05985 [Deinococcus irradiatisoli]|uniref:Sel1 repeat family protein n=1 Tax=Deinococcus irradiatisoli TaxID=2202254 RepID=A0A2Z3JIQ2_9DEIO|nr:hypothetical protein [Deinococcus irradiatisoli]AWN22829.1 hypothetical protein DKM44_05985 [Deinococcus irradiatisoli]
MHAQELIAEADFILSGDHYNPLLTWEDAARMYEAAGDLGSGEALSKLAYMYWSNSSKPYYSADHHKVFELYKKAVGLGYVQCIAALIFLSERVDDPLFLEIWAFIFDHAASLELSPSHVATYLQRCIDSGLQASIDRRILGYKKEIFAYHNTFIEFYQENLESLKAFYRQGDLTQLIEESLSGKNAFSEVEMDVLIKYRNLRDQLQQDLQEAEKAQHLIAALEEQKSYGLDMLF